MARPLAAIARATEKHGLRAEDVFIDPLVLPVSTGMDGDRRSAMELVEGVRLISTEFPQVQITCGLSNASFGLKPAARVVLNSVLMHELTEAGLTSAILHEECARSRSGGIGFSPGTWKIVPVASRSL